MDNRANTIFSDSDCVMFNTPYGTRAAKLALSLVMFVGAILFSVAAAVITFVLAAQFGAPAIVACVPAAVAYILFFRLGWRIVTAPLRFQIVLQPDAVTIGSGWLRRSYAYDEIEAISLPESKSDGHGVALESGAAGSFVYLTDDESRCAALLRSRCRNAIFVDRSGKEHMPPSPDQPLLAIGALYRRNRWLALSAIWPIVFLGSLCAVEATGLLCVLFGLTNPRPPVSDVLIIAVKFCAQLVGLALLIRFGTKRLRMTRAIRDRMAEYQRNHAE
jgi:hypothetical protein